MKVVDIDDLGAPIEVVEIVGLGFQGPPGPMGPAGVSGPPGPQGPPGAGGGISSITVSGSHAVTVSEAGNVFVQSLAAPAVITLPLSPPPGHWVFVKDTDGSAATYGITVQGASGQQIDDMANYAITYGYGAVRLSFSGTRWGIG